MTYHHKRDSCSKETREILDNIFHHELSGYELPEQRVKASSSKADSHDEGRENVLPEEAAGLLAEFGVHATDSETDMALPAARDRYLPPHQLDFEAAEAKESYEKKKKHRNYVEFRPDYEKT